MIHSVLRHCAVRWEERANSVAKWRVIEHCRLHFWHYKEKRP